MYRISERRLTGPSGEDRCDAIVEAVATCAPTLRALASAEVGMLDTLALIGAAAKADRVTVYRSGPASDGTTVLTPRQEWLPPWGVPGPNGDSSPGDTALPLSPALVEDLSTGEPVVAHVSDLLPQEATGLAGLAGRSVLMVPLFVTDRWWGAMALERGSEDDAWSEGEIRSLRAAAALLGVSLQQERTEEALRESEDRYRLLIETSPDAILVHRGGAITYANPAGARLLGAKDVDALVGRSILEFVHADSRPIVLGRLQRLREGRSVPMQEETFVRLDGSSVPVEVATTPLTIDGQGSVLVVARDATDRRRAEEAVRLSEARKGAVLESALDAVITADSDGHIIEFNPAAEEMFGIPRSRAMGQPIAELVIPPSLRARHRRALARYLATGEAKILGTRVEMTAMRSDGSVFPAEMAVTRVEVPGPAVFTAYVRDITDRRRSERALRESEERYRRLVELSPDAIAVHTEGRLVFANRAAAVLLGAASPQDLIGMDIREVVHPDCWATVEERIRLEAEGRDVPLIEERFIRLDGSVIDVEVAGMALTFEGRPAGQIVARDITERKATEAAIRRRSEYLTMLHQTSIALMERRAPREALEAIVIKAADLVGSRHGYVYLVEPGGDQIEVKVGVGSFTGWEGHRMSFGEGLAGKVWESGRQLVVDDYDQWEGRSPSFPTGVFHAVAGLPLRSGSEVVGVLGVAHVEEGKHLSEDEIELLGRFANLASIVLDNARLYADAQTRLEERERAELQLREAEAKYRTLVERIPAITYTAAFGETAPWLYVSPQIEAILGFTPEEWMVYPNIWSRQLHPDDRERVLALEQLSQETGVPMLCEYRLFAKDGRVVWVRDESVVAWTELGEPLLQGVMLDITERKEAERQLQGAEARYRTLVEQIPAITYIDAIDPERPDRYVTTYVSPQIQQMLGYSPDEFIAQEDLWPRLIHPEDLERVLAADRDHYRQGVPLSLEYRLIARDGRVVWVLDEGVSIRDEQGNLRLSQGILYDITERKQVEHELGRALQIERRATDRLRALDELKNTFLHAVSHELRTPLAAVLGFALTLEREELQLPPDERKHIVRRLAANARKLDQLLADLLDLDRLDRGILEPRRRPTDMAALVRRVVENSEVLGSRSVRVEAQLLVASVDGPKVERIVENLLVNAARHTQPDRAIWVKVGPEDGGVLLVVEDDGPGVPEHLRESIFEPFRRGPDAPAHAPGVGIGLSLVARFAGLHGGRAWVEDRPGGGASFRVFLPG